MVPSISEDRSFKYTADDIDRRATRSHQTHRNKLLSAIYRSATLLTKPATNGIHDILVLNRKGTGYGAELGPGGESKRFKVITAVAWISLAVVTLPLAILGVIGNQLSHPGRRKDKLVFMNATEDGYIPPEFDEENGIHIATQNVAWLPPPVDVIKDVYASQQRAEELAKWINQQPINNLPLCIGLQEAFDPDASRAFTNGIKALYPYAITSVGWANIPIAGSNSGLQFHSRVPIKSAAFYPFQDLVGFGIKCSGRGLLRVELDLGKGRSAMVYVTHLQAHAEYRDIRRNELEAITKLMRDDQKQDPRDGHYYLIGDLNVSNVDDESLEVINEHEDFRKDGKPLSPKVFYDPYLEDHDEHGEGTFYSGADQMDRGEHGYGTATFLQGPKDAVKDCRYDYILRLVVEEDPQQVYGHAELHTIVSDKFKTCSLSDHKMVTAIFRHRD